MYEIINHQSHTWNEHAIEFLSPYSDVKHIISLRSLLDQDKLIWQYSEERYMLQNLATIKL